MIMHISASYTFHAKYGMLPNLIIMFNEVIRYLCVLCFCIPVFMSTITHSIQLPYPFKYKQDKKHQFLMCVSVSNWGKHRLEILLTKTTKEVYYEK